MSKHHVRRFEAAIARADRARRHRERRFLNVVVRLPFAEFGRAMRDAAENLRRLIAALPICKMPGCRAIAAGGVRPGVGRVCPAHFAEYLFRPVRIRAAELAEQKAAETKGRTITMTNVAVHVAPVGTSPQDAAAWQRLGTAARMEIRR